MYANIKQLIVFFSKGEPWNYSKEASLITEILYSEILASVLKPIFQLC